MSTIGAEGRSFLPLAHEDLERLAEIAHQDLEDFFRRHPQWAEFYGDRVLGVALCQGAAQHHVDGTTGINDFDLYTFFRKNPRKNWYARRLKAYDYGDAKFGQSVDCPEFIGRRVDCMGRAIEADEGEEVVAAIRRYLQSAGSRTAKLLAAKAVVLLDPACGVVVWPVEESE